MNNFPPNIERFGRKIPIWRMGTVWWNARVAYFQRHKHEGLFPLCAFTLIETLVVLVIMTIVAALLLPTFKKVLQKSQGVGCMSNLRQLGASIGSYTSDHDGKFPERIGDYPDGPGRGSGQQWDAQIAPYLLGCDPPSGTMNLYNTAMKTPKIAAVFHCPAATPYPPITRSYAMNEYLSRETPGEGSRGSPADHRYAGLIAPSATIMLTEIGLDLKVSGTAGNSDSNLAGGLNDGEYISWGYFMYFPYKFRHEGKINILFADGHVDGRKPVVDINYATLYDLAPQGVKFSNSSAVTPMK